MENSGPIAETKSWTMLLLRVVYLEHNIHTLTQLCHTFLFMCVSGLYLLAATGTQLSLEERMEHTEEINQKLQSENSVPKRPVEYCEREHNKEKVFRSTQTEPMHRSCLDAVHQSRVKTILCTLKRHIRCQQECWRCARVVGQVLDCLIRMQNYPVTPLKKRFQNF